MAGRIGFSAKNYNIATPEIVKRVALFVKGALSLGVVGSTLEYHYEGSLPWWIPIARAVTSMAMEHIVEFIGYIETHQEQEIVISGPSEAVDQLTVKTQDVPKEE